MKQQFPNIKIHLEAFEVCFYKKECLYYKGCWGCRKDRNKKFVCDVKELYKSK